MNQRMIIRHGDVLLRQIDSLPKEKKEIKDKTLAYGEVTGHSHRFTDPSLVTRYSSGDKMYLELSAIGELVHEEHLPQVILPGVYEQITEREHDYIEESTRAVVD